MPTKPMTKGERARERILTEAVDLLAEHGIEGTSFQMIADRIGVSQSAVMHHFRSKPLLLDAVVMRSVGRNNDIVADLGSLEDDAAKRLLDFCRGNLMWVMRYRKDAKVFAMLYYLAGRDKSALKTLATIVGRGREVILGHLLAGEREGVFRFNQPAPAVAKLIQDAIIGAMLSATAFPKKAVLAELEKSWESALVLLAGWKPKH
jgi:AcrR family transcriptional regulator